MLYDIIKDYQKNEMMLLLLQKGAIPISLLGRLTYYEFYKKELQTLKKPKAIQVTAVEFNVSDMTIRRAIKEMER